jgi:FkbM family methyltransferase
MPFKYKRSVKEKLGVPSLHWSLQNLKRKNFYPAVVLDIGAYEGFWTLDLLEVFPKAKVLMVEAQINKESFLKAVKQKNNNVDYAISLLSSADGETKLFLKNETASHVISTAVAGEQYQQIKTQTLDVLLETMNFPFPEFLKLDVQGHEMEVLKGAAKSLANATICLLEISLLNLGDDGPLLAEMVTFMDEKGYQAYDISQFIRRPFDKALYQVDMFFIKKDSPLITDKRWG